MTMTLVVVVVVVVVAAAVVVVVAAAAAAAAALLTCRTSLCLYSQPFNVPGYRLTSQNKGALSRDGRNSTLYRHLSVVTPALIRTFVPHVLLFSFYLIFFLVFCFYFLFFNSMFLFRLFCSDTLP
jgi:hypothetical protein